MRALLAALPILLILPLMLVWRWPAARAGAAGVVAALSIALTTFGLGVDVHPALGRTRAVTGAVAEALFTTATILWIILPALCIHQLQQRTHGIGILQRAIAAVSPDPRLLILLVAWFFALFLEGAAGFGTPVALAAPFLVGAGVPRVQAVSMAMIGHAAGVSFGAVGTPVAAQVAATGFSGLDIARATGLYHGLLAGTLLVFLARLMRPDTKADDEAVALPWGWIVTAGVSFLVPFSLLAVAVGPELPTLGGALVGGLTFVWLLRRRRAANASVDLVPLLRAASPYLVLVALILATRLLAPLRATLDGVRWEWTLWQVFSGQVSPLFHPGTMLMAGFVVGAMLQRVRAREVADAFLSASRQVGPAAVALVSMLVLSRLLVHAGMIEVLATTAATTVGIGWPLVAPLAGVLGTFVTGSATASNILFTEFQVATARELGLPALAMTGVQGFGAAVGNIICPHNIIAGGATVELAGKEGEVMRRTIGPCLVYAVLGGVVAMLVTRG